MAAGAAASSSKSLLSFLCLLLLASTTSHAKLSHQYYSSSCRGLQPLVRNIVQQVLSRDPTMGASLLRLHFHDCFVNGCDASLLLDDTPFFTGEKNAAPNMNSLRGFDVIDLIKSSVENICKQKVSCADILALVARDSVALLGGPYWAVYLGRRDARTTSKAAAVANLPNATQSVSSLISTFSAQGLAPWDMIALSGGHTIGTARCVKFRQHIYGDSNIDPGFAAFRRQSCPPFGGDSNRVPLDFQSPVRFDNQYFKDLVARKGLLHSDQELYNGGQFDFFAGLYSVNQTAFFNDFANAMIKMGNIRPLMGSQGEIRKNCRRWN